jgi:peptidoglycan/LPS O-acetylase OafA/YrhL
LIGRYRFDWSTLFGIILLTFSSSLFYVTKDNTIAALILLLRATSIALIYIGVARGNISRRVFSNSWVTLIGGACYSIYLVHVPVIQLGSSIIFKLIHPSSLIMSWVVSAIFLVPLSVISGLVFYVFIERPCMDRNWPRRVWHFVRR